MPRLRFTIRRVMIAVAIVAAGLWVTQMRRRSAQYQENAQSFRDIARVRVVGETEERTKAHEVHWYGLARKYGRAARYPWLPVDSDAPLPN